jgi:WLM domain-containing protein
MPLKSAEKSTGVGLVIAGLILLFIYIKWYRRYSKFNTSRVPICENITQGGCTYYNVHNTHKDQKEAAMLMDNITGRIDILMNHLLHKYGSKSYNPSLDPNKEGRIDIIPMADAYADGATDESFTRNQEYMQERITQLFERYDKESIFEISPKNKANLTSYTENKGEQLVLCLREKKETNGDHKLHDPNTLMFVVAHELTHIMNDTWGHESEFWELFKTMLENSIEVGVYEPVNYRIHPINYCGLDLNYNPLYDTFLEKARGSENMQSETTNRPKWNFKNLVKGLNV